MRSTASMWSRLRTEGLPGRQERLFLEPLAEALECHQVVGADVAEVHVGADSIDEPDLLVALERLEQQGLWPGGAQDQVHQVGANLAADRADLAPLDH